MIPSPARRRTIAGALSALALIVCGTPWDPSPVLRAQDQALFVSVVDASSGAPVTDLTPEELAVQWDGVNCETVALEPIDWPVRVSVFVDNSRGRADAVSQIREGLRSFAEALPADMEIALFTIARQPRLLTPHTTDRAALAGGIDLVVADTSASARYLDALIEEAGRLDDDSDRRYFPVVVMVAGDGPEGSTGQQPRFEEMLRRMADNAATVHTLMFSHGNLNALQVQVGENVSQVTRGSYESLTVDSAFLTALPALGQDIARKHELVSHQYRVIYAPPDGASDQPSISIGSSRRGLDLTPTIDGNVP